MIANDQGLAVTQQRLRQLQDLLLRLRQCETAENYPTIATAYLLEIDKMNEEVRSYLASPPTEETESTSPVHWKTHEAMPSGGTERTVDNG